MALNIDFLKKNIARIIKERNLSLAFGAGMFLVNLILAVCVLQRNQQVVLVPLGFSQEAWVQKNQVSSSYLEQMAVFFARQLLDVNSSSAEFQSKNILEHVESNLYNELKQRLTLEAELLRKDNLSMSFRPTAIKANPKTLKVEISGLLNSYIGNQFKNQKQETYEFGFSYRSGILLINKFQLKSSKGGETDV